MKGLIAVARHSKISPHLWVALSDWISRIALIAAQLIGLPLLTTWLSPAEFAAYATPHTRCGTWRARLEAAGMADLATP